MFFLVYENKKKTVEIKSGIFYCPACKEDREYKRFEIQECPMLYLFSLGNGEAVGEYIECQTCENTFQTDAVDKSPEICEREFQEFLAEENCGIRDTMIRMMLADEKIVCEEVPVIRGIYYHLTGTEYIPYDLNDDIARLESDGISFEDHVERLNRKLGKKGRMEALKAAIIVAYADGDIVKEEKKYLKTLYTGLGISRSDYKKLLKELAPGK